MTMGIGSTLKIIKAQNLLKKGKQQEAKAVYEEAFQAGMTDARSMLSYALLLLRDGAYEKAKEVVLKAQKLPMTEDQKSQLYIDYAVCCLKLGEIEKGLGVLERQHGRHSSGLMYETLGYYYVEAYDASRKPDLASFLKMEEAAKKVQEEPQDPRFPKPAAQAEEAEAAEQEEAAAPEQRLEQYWQKCIEKAVAFNQEALEYDDEDPICLDNMGQVYYRVVGDKAKALEYFNQALAMKPGQIDTLWFLSRYDLEKGDKAAAIEKLEKTLAGRFSPLNYVTKPMVEEELRRIKGM